MRRFCFYFTLAITALLLKQGNAQADDQQKQKRKIIQGAKQIMMVTDGVWVAAGYDFANMILFEGNDGMVIVDTLTHDFRARIAYKDLLQAATNNTKILKAIILTHFHLDHIGGANTLKREYGNSETKIFAHSSMANERSKYARVVPFYSNRASNQWGKEIYPKSLPCMRKKEACLDTATVTDTVEDGDRINISGLDFEFLHTQGETNDQISIWLASKDLLVAADTVYASFPNIYSLRGTPARDAYAWYHSVGRMRELNPHHLVLCHGDPIQGSFQVDFALTAYRDGIQFVHDQTVRLMNKGFKLDDIVQTVRLPPLLRDKKILNEVYGKVEWSVRGIYDYYNGWFDGEADNIFPLSRSKTAKFMQKLLLDEYNGTAYEKILHHANTTLTNSKKEDGTEVEDNLQWGLYLCGIASEIRDSDELQQIAMDITKAVMEVNKENMIANNFYLVYLKRLQLRISGPMFEILNPIEHLPLAEAFEGIPFRFKAEICDPALTLKLLINITDDKADFVNGYIMRNCIIEHIKNPKMEDFNHEIKLSEVQFRQIFSKTLDLSNTDLHDLKTFVAFID